MGSDGMGEKISFLKGQKLSFRKIGIDKFLYCLLAGVALLILSIPTSNLTSTKNETNSSSKTSNHMADKQDSLSGLGSFSGETYLENRTLEITEDTYERLLEVRLEEVLSYVEGAGKIKVMVTLKASGERIILTESPYTKNTVNEQDGGGGTRNTIELSQSDTVVYLEENGTKIPYMIQERAPEIEGILVIAQGADNDSVKKELNAAITALFDLQSHKIKICKMAD